MSTQYNRLLADYFNLAEASYADFSKAQIGTKYNEYLAKDAMLNDKEKKWRRTPESLADLVFDNYEIMAHWKDREDESSFSGTLFKGKMGGSNPGKYVLALKGTKEFYKDFLKTDLADIAYDGIAHHQVVDLYNFWQQITCIGEYEVAKIISGKELEELEELENWEKDHERSTSKGYFLDNLTWKRIVFRNSHEIFSPDDERYDGLGLSIDKVTVTGHSLGGHLSAAFSRLFPDVTDHAYMINGAGFGGRASIFEGYTLQNNINKIFDVLGGSSKFDKNKITNFIGDKNMDLVAQDWFIGLEQPGATPELFIESGGLDGDTLGHGMGPMDNTMSAMALFARLDSELDNKNHDDFVKDFNKLFEEAAATGMGGVESIVKKLAVQLLGIDPPITKGYGEILFFIISKLHEKIKKEGLEHSLTVKLMSSLNQDDIKEVYDPVKGMGYRYALKHLYPFSLSGDKLYDEKNGLLKDEVPTLKFLDINDQSTYAGMTKEYIKHRLDMLQLLSKNEHASGYAYQDRASNISISSKPHDADAVISNVIFGTDSVNELYDWAGDAYIFAGGGKDTLNGGKGRDYLEGGPDFDTYYIEDHDTVFDADGKGELRFGKDKAEYFIPETPNSQDSWISSDSNGEPDGKFRAVRDGQNLVVTSVANEANKVTVKDYFNSRNTLDGALDLYDVAPKPEPEKAKEYTITPKRYDVHNEYNLGPDSYLVQGSFENDLIWANSALPGKSGYGLVTQTGAGNDIVYGSLYPDIIEGGTDTDVLLGSAPKTALTGKQKILDANLMSGNEGRDFIMGGFGNDIIHAGNINEHLQLQERKGQGDWVNGAEGNDSLYGSAARDIVQGGAGTDTIRGGAGNDLLVGDSNAMVYAHIDRSHGAYLPITHIHSYNLKEKRWNRIEEVQISNRLIDKSVAWKLEIDRDKQDYFITRDYHDWENNASLVAEEEGAGDDIEGGTGDDMLIGQRGDDVLDGQGGNDIVFGDDNRDKSIVGNDHLRGGSGSDTLIGGKGADSYYFFREELQPEEGKPAPTDIVIDDGRGDGNKMDEIFLDAFSISSLKWNYDKERKIWSDDENGWQITKKGSELNITHKDYPGVIRVLDYAYGDYELPLSERKNGPFPDPEPAEPVPPQPVPPQPVPPQPVPPQPEPPKPEQPKPEQPKPEQPKPEQPQAPTAGKPLAAQSIHEKDKLTYTLAEDAFHTANKDDKLSYSARLADGKPLPQWLNFDAATRTFSGTPGNDDVGVLDIEISVQGKGGAASQHLALNVINVNDAPYKSAPFSLHSANSDGEVKCNSRIYIRDIDKGDKLTFSAEMRDGQPLPSWLSIDSETGVLTGSLPFVRGGKDYFVRITATDKAGESASGVLMIRGKFPQIGLIGSDKDDVLKGIVRSAYGVNIKIHGYGGNDTIVGGNLHDDLYGDKGNDVLDGGSGNDIYHFARGDGNDIINNHDTGARRHDSIDFSDMNRSDFDIRREGNNLVLRSKDGNNQITVTNHFQPGWQIDSIYFADGMTLDHDAINSLTGAQNPPQGNYTDPAAQALQMNQAIASLNSQAQPLDALAVPDLQPRPLLAAGNP